MTPQTPEPAASGRPPLPAREAAARIASRLVASGCTAYFAGGCVRDRLLGLEPADYDVATDATPARIAQIFPGARGVGESFGVMLVRSGGRTVEVATFRSDGRYLDGRRPESVDFGTAEQDARRRDFTINGLFEDPESGRIVDFVGGVEDLQKRLLRAIGSPDQRFQEDRLRVLRAVRFAARFDLTWDPATQAAVRRHAGDLMGVSRERVGQEVRRMLSHPSRGRSVAEVESMGLAAAVLMEPEGTLEGRRVASLPPAVPLAAALAAWQLDRALPAREPEGVRCERWTRALVLSNAESRLLLETLEIHAALEDRWDAWDLAARKRSAAREGFPAALLLRRAEAPEAAEVVATAFERFRQEGLAPPPLVTGDHLIALGMRPGPAFRGILDALYDRQLRGELTNPGDALQAARELVERGAAR